MSKRLIIGTRGSELALWQARFVQGKIQAAFPDLSVDIKVIVTSGDKIMDVALSKIGDKGLFTNQIEDELKSGEIDLAVHSLKDLQTSQPDGLTIGAVCKREVPNDVFISNKFASLGDLPEAARVATGSLRRRSQLLFARPDLKIEEIRGNVPTRIRKMEEADLDGIILAYAGVHRLALDARIREVIRFEMMLPAVGQGAVAVEIREDNAAAAQAAAALDDPVTRICVTAERAFLRKLEGGCNVPVAAMAVIDNGSIALDGMVAARDGGSIMRERITGDAGSPELLGVELAERLLDRGAGDLLAAARATADKAAEHVL